MSKILASVPEEPALELVYPTRVQINFTLQGLLASMLTHMRTKNGVLLERVFIGATKDLGNNLVTGYGDFLPRSLVQI